MQLAIHDANGNPLDAKIEVEGSTIIVHSRSGSAAASARNPDYRPALEAILERLGRARQAYAAYLDSQPVQHQSLGSRALGTNESLTGSPSEQFDALLRAMNAGSSSHGAYRRVRIDVEGLVGPGLARIIGNQTSQGEPPTERLSRTVQKRVKPHHVHRAVDRLLRGARHNFDGSRDYDLITPDGERLPPKAVFGLALEEALGIEAFPGHFSAGIGMPCFTILEDAGYAIVPKDAPTPVGKGNATRQPLVAKLRPPHPTSEQVEAALAGLPVTEEERSWVEGNLKVASHLKRERATGLSKAKRAAFIAEHGKLFCERCSMDPIAEYGPTAGEACIEVHHAKTAVSAMDEGHATSLDDLQCLCANCHRVLHRELATAAR